MPRMREHKPSGRLRDGRIRLQSLRTSHRREHPKPRSRMESLHSPRKRRQSKSRHPNRLFTLRQRLIHSHPRRKRCLRSLPFTQSQTTDVAPQKMAGALKSPRFPKQKPHDGHERTPTPLRHSSHTILSARHGGHNLPENLE